MLRIDEALLQLGLQAVVLLGRQVSITRRVDERAGGTRGVVEQGLVPARSRVVDVDRRGGGLDGREAVVAVEQPLLLLRPPPLVAAAVEDFEALLFTAFRIHYVGKWVAIRRPTVSSVRPMLLLTAKPQTR